MIWRQELFTCIIHPNFSAWALVGRGSRHAATWLPQIQILFWAREKHNQNTVITWTEYQMSCQVKTAAHHSHFTNNLYRNPRQQCVIHVKTQIVRSSCFVASALHTNIQVYQWLQDVRMADTAGQWAVHSFAMSSFPELEVRWLWTACNFCW